MFWPELLIAFVLAGLFVAILVGVLSWRYPREGEAGATALFLFLIFFLVLWAGALWVQPIGPLLWGVAWIPLIFLGIFLVLVMAALMPADRTAILRDKTEQLAQESAVVTAFTIVFWVLLIVLVLAIVVAYMPLTAVVGPLTATTPG
jgi:hypothetical protein